MISSKLLCPHCRKQVKYYTRCRVGDTTIHDVDIHYFQKYGVCKECGNEIFVPGLDDENDIKAEDCYRIKLNLMTLSQFKEVLNDFGYDKLSEVSGISVKELHLYERGKLLSRNHSDALKHVCDIQ